VLLRKCVPLIPRVIILRSVPITTTMLLSTRVLGTCY
jgi:hypothetical protein